MSTNICLLNNHHLAIRVWTRFYCQMCDEPQHTGWTYGFFFVCFWCELSFPMK